MPAKDKYHDNVRNALIKDGWAILEDPAYIVFDERYVYIDLRAEKDDDISIFVEIKVFGDVDSPLTYFSHSIGQYIFYKSILDYLNVDMPIYLAVPQKAYDNFLTEPVITHTLQYIQAKLLICDVENEVVVKWIP